MLYGKQQFQKINRLLLRQLQDEPFLIVAHRGFAHANIIENTVESMRVAFKLGADIVETDTMMTKDGTIFLLYTGTEKRLFGQSFSPEAIKAKQFINKHYYNNIGELSSYQPVTLCNFIKQLPRNRMIHLDRGWSHLSELLAVLDHFPNQQQQFVIKIKPKAEQIATLRQHRIKYMTVVIVNHDSELQYILNHLTDEINIIGIELVAANLSDSHVQLDVIKHIKALGLTVMINTLTLNTTTSLFGTLDDDNAILASPENIWQEVMINYQPNMINTDWAPLLSQYRRQLEH